MGIAIFRLVVIDITDIHVLVCHASTVLKTFAVVTVDGQANGMISPNLDGDHLAVLGVDGAEARDCCVIVSRRYLVVAILAMERSRDDGSRPEFAELSPLVGWTHVDADSFSEAKIKMGLVDSIEGLPVLSNVFC